ncbi:MAG: hypothetical protein DI585_01275 [Pseudomonas fluorescens]|nr:MAG: hypothetical protein DI585_01275 [Pseudomonas fluorescens]
MTGPRGSMDGVGVLNAANGGEAPDVWRKTNRADTENGMKKALAQGVASPALKEAWRRLLLTEAGAPLAGDQGVRDSWLAVRANALQGMGQYEAAWSLWKEVPASALADKGLAEGWVEAKLLSGQAKDACEVAKARATGGGSQASDWGVAMAVCQVVAPTTDGGNVAAARLSLQIVEPLLRSKNPALLRVLTAVQEGRPVATLSGPTTMVDGFGGAVLAAYPALVGGDIMPRLPDVTLRRLTASEALPVDLRGRAAVALARQTSVIADGSAAWALVSATEFNGVMPDAVAVARGFKDVSASALNEYVQAALRLGLKDEAVKALPNLMKAEGLDAAANKNRMQVQLAVKALQGKVDDATWDAWMVGQNLEIQTSVRQAQRTLLAIEAMGVSVPGRVWKQMRDRSISVSSLVDPAWQRLLADAVRTKDVPSVLILISDAFAGQPPAGAVPVVIGASVEALRAIGMDDIAKRVAMEAILGLPASHLIPLVREAAPAAVSATQPVAIGADSLPKEPVSVTTPVSGAIVPGMLPPPRVIPVEKPTIKAPTKPVPPKVN